MLFKTQTSFLLILKRRNNNFFYLFDEFLTPSDSMQTIPAKRLGLDLNVIHKFSQNLVMNLGYMKLDDDDADISTNAAVRLTPKMAYNVGFSHFMSLGNGKVHTRIDYSYDDDMEVTSNYSTSSALAPFFALVKEKPVELIYNAF